MEATQLFRQLEVAAQRALQRSVGDARAGPRLLTLARGGPAVACLIPVAMAPDPEGARPLPIGAGTTLVGRSAVADYVVERRVLAGVVEGAQWKIVWTADEVTVEDTASTNGSILVPRALRAAAPRELVALGRASIGAWLGWDGTKVWTDRRRLRDGDLLVNAYAAFLYSQKR